jgi:hypothetical protein
MHTLVAVPDHGTCVEAPPSGVSSRTRNAMPADTSRANAAVGWLALREAGLPLLRPRLARFPSRPQDARMRGEWSEKPWVPHAAGHRARHRLRVDDRTAFGPSAARLRVDRWSASRVCLLEVTLGPPGIEDWVLQLARCSHG